ncbi:MAG: Trm112 family protein [Anaerolineae bacterium]
MISKELLEILVCPACKTKVELQDDMLACGACGRRYPVRDGIPIMLIEEGDKHRIQIEGSPA